MRVWREGVGLGPCWAPPSAHARVLTGAHASPPATPWHLCTQRGCGRLTTCVRLVPAYLRQASSQMGCEFRTLLALSLPRHLSEKAILPTVYTVIPGSVPVFTRPHTCSHLPTAVHTCLVCNSPCP